MKRYRHYNTSRLADRFTKEHIIKKDSLLDYVANISRAYMCLMPANHWKHDLHLLPLAPAMIVPQRDKKSSFEQVADRRAQEIIEMARSSDRRCLVFWSGGIDSTCTLAALLRNGCQPVVAMNAQSVYENQGFYKRHIQGKLDIQFVHDIEYSDSSKYFFVRSGGGSSIMGGDNNAVYLYEHYDNAKREISVELVQHLGKGIGRQYVERFYEDVMSSADEMDIEIATLWDFVCFYDLIYKISYEFWLQDHHLFFSNNASPETIRNHGCWSQKFFITEDFYRWALYDATLEDRLGHKLTDHKWAFKHYISSVDKDPDYMYKLKTGSYGNWIPIAEHREYLTLDEDYRFCNWDMLKDQLYQANSKIL